MSAAPGRPKQAAGSVGVANTTDHAVATPAGRLFARSWTPDADLHVPPVLLFHDSLGSVELWRDFPAALAQATGRRVLAYDRLGFGRSDACAEQLTPAFVRHESLVSVPALCAQLGIDRFVAFGHSVGGAMAVETAAAFGERCTALVTESAQTFAEDRTLEGIRVAQAQFAQAGQLERLARYHGDKARWVLDAWTGTWLSPAFADWSIHAVLPAVRCPVLAIHGEDDEYGSLVHPRRIAASVSGPAEALLLPGCGHVPHREQPQAVLAAVARFLEADQKS
jgi:pimeloyl-ACP methyl ester carboxylesterase